MSANVRFNKTAICLGSRCAPPKGSFTILSIRFNAFNRCAVSPKASAASDARSAVFQRIEAQPSGEITEYVAYCSMMTASPTAIANAPPEPPSPMMVAISGTLSSAITYRLCPIASD